MKACSKCKIEKHETEFRVRSNRPSGRASQCKDCQRTNERSDDGKNRRKEYRLSSAGSAAISRANRKYRTTTKGRDSERTRRLRYLQTAKGREYNQQKWRRRRERQHCLDMHFTPDDVRRVYERFDSTCFNCCCTDHLTIDHHYPLSRGHALTLNNAVLLCVSCNSSKINKMPEEFYTQEQLRYLDEVLFE